MLVSLIHHVVKFQRYEAFEDTKRENIRMSSNSFGGAEFKVNDDTAKTLTSMNACLQK